MPLRALAAACPGVERTLPETTATADHPPGRELFDDHAFPLKARG